MTDAEVNQLHKAVRRQSAASVDLLSLQTVIEKTGRTRSPVFAEMVRKVNLDRELSPRLNRLIRESTIYLPAHLAASIGKRLRSETESSLPVRP